MTRLTSKCSRMTCFLLPYLPGCRPYSPGPDRSPLSIWYGLRWLTSILTDTTSIATKKERRRSSSIRSPSELRPTATKNVTSGKHYFYAVTAVDVRGNESGHSEEADENVP